jgi:hypothetical protein
MVPVSVFRDWALATPDAAEAATGMVRTGHFLAQGAVCHVIDTA